LNVIWERQPIASTCQLENCIYLDTDKSWSLEMATEDDDDDNNKYNYMVTKGLKGDAGKLR